MRLRRLPSADDLISYPWSSVLVEDVEPGARVVLRARQTDGAGRAWRSQATFLASADRTVDLTRIAPVTGSYRGVDPSGLLWSMTPVDETAGVDRGSEQDDAPVLAQAFDPEGLDACSVTVALDVDGRVVDEAIVRRAILKTDVMRIPLRRPGIVATLFVPSGSGPHPAVLDLTGSGGGLVEFRARVLASHGFAVLSLAYFGLPGLPPALVGVPLEYVERAVSWFRTLPQVAGRRIGIVGSSKGGELALLFASSFPSHVGGVVGYVPSGLVHIGLSADAAVRPRSSWTLGGAEVPYLRTAGDGAGGVGPPGTLARSSDMSVRTADLYAAAMADPDQVAAAEIPLERITAPVLLLSAGRDGIWPSTRLCEMAMDRAHRGHAAGAYTHRDFPDAGHNLGVGVPNIPTAGTRVVLDPGTPALDLGGSPSADAHARSESWPEVVDFLQTALAC